jgi:hypothetical protein
MAKVTKNKISIRGKTLTFTIKYSIDLDDIELESFIQDELDQLRGMGTVEIANVEVEE